MICILSRKTCGTNQGQIFLHLCVSIITHLEWIMLRLLLLPRLHETNVEKFRQRFVLEECLDPMVLSESDEEFVLYSVPLIEQEQE
ncbi:hypothetical protein Hanom_Chr17g01535381 [Helianthus anomalus]